MEPVAEDEPFESASGASHSLQEWGDRFAKQLEQLSRRLGVERQRADLLQEQNNLLRKRLAMVSQAPVVQSWGQEPSTRHGLDGTAGVLTSSFTRHDIGDVEHHPTRRRIHHLHTYLKQDFESNKQAKMSFTAALQSYRELITEGEEGLEELDDRIMRLAGVAWQNAELIMNVTEKSPCVTALAAEKPRDVEASDNDVRNIPEAVTGSAPPMGTLSVGPTAPSSSSRPLAVGTPAQEALARGSRGSLPTAALSERRMQALRRHLEAFQTLQELSKTLEAQLQTERDRNVRASTPGVATAEEVQELREQLAAVREEVEVYRLLAVESDNELQRFKTAHLCK